MKAKIQLLAAVTGACLTSGCVVPAPYPYDRGPVEYGRPVAYSEPVVYGAPDEIIVPEVIVVENGVRHDRFFYQRHPEFYRRDRMRYPERFGHLPPPRHEAVEYRGHGPAPALYGRPNVSAGDPRQAPREDPKSKKKKKHDDDHDHN